MFEVVNNWATCKCFSHPSKLFGSVKELSSSIIDFVFHPFCFEASKMSFYFGRFLGSLIGKPYVHTIGDDLFLEDLAHNMYSYGCGKGNRYLVDGRCPNNRCSKEER